MTGIGGRAVMLAAALSACLALAGCSYGYTLLARFDGGRLTFFSDEYEEDGIRCLSELLVIAEDGRTAWGLRIDRERDGSCTPRLPLTYGMPPPGAQVFAGPETLLPGRLYVLKGHGGDMLEGAFVLYHVGERLALENVAPDLPHVRQVSERYWERQSLQRESIAGEEGGD